MTKTVEKRRRKKPYKINFKTIDEHFLSHPRFIPVIKRFIEYIEYMNLNELELQKDEKIVTLLMYAFEINKKPSRDHVESVKALFKRTTVRDFMKQLYKYSETIAMYLWVDRVQEIVADPEEKNRILVGDAVNSSGYQLYCVLTDTEYEEKIKSKLANDQNVQLFRKVLKTSKSEDLKSFIKAHFKNDFSEEEKLEIFQCTKNFL